MKEQQRQKRGTEQASAQRPASDEAGSGPARPPVGDAQPQGSSRSARRGQKEGAVQLAPANVEASPRMDRGDSAGGSGESLAGGRATGDVGNVGAAGEATRRGAVDTQYGTRSGMKTEASRPPPQAPQSPDASSARSADAEPSDTPNPGSSEKSSGADRDTMSGSRPGGRS